MVYTIQTFYCDECNRGHPNYDEARSCETQHIVDSAVSSFKSKLDDIFTRKPIPARKVQP